MRLRRSSRRRTAGALLLGAVAVACDAPTEPLPPLRDLPADLASVGFAATGSLSVPYFMLELRHPEGFTGFVVVEGAGRPVWYHRTAGSPLGFTRRANGDFVLLDGERGLVEVTAAGHPVRVLPQEARPGRRMHHDVISTPAHTILFLAEDWRRHDGAPVNGEALWEWDPEGGVTVKRWSAWNHLDPLLDSGARSRPDDWLHANALAIGARGNVLVSFHFLDQVVSLDPTFLTVEWRLGGTRATIAVDDPFSGQHTAQEVAPHRLLLFDNGFELPDRRYSRAVEYRIEGSHARVAWQWQPPRDNWARVISGARRLPGGGTLVGFGTPAGMPAGSTGPIEVYEVTAAGAVAWHLEIGGAVSSMYRASPVFSLQRP